MIEAPWIQWFADGRKYGDSVPAYASWARSCTAGIRQRNRARRKDWQRIFGSPEADYEPETYTPRPHSHGFVRHLPNWYAQAHPDEDFAETFAARVRIPRQ